MDEVPRPDCHEPWPPDLPKKIESQVVGLSGPLDVAISDFSYNELWSGSKGTTLEAAACEIQAFLLSCALIWISGDQLACSAMVTCLLWDTE